MQDAILESIFLDTHLWAEVIEHGCEKGIPMDVLYYIQSPLGRAEICEQIERGKYTITPPHTGYRLKEDGTERTFFANEPLDRLLLNAIYKWLSRNEAEMIHPSCRSYQEGIGVGQIVKNFSRDIEPYYRHNVNQIIGCKFDIHKYFESIDRKLIHEVLNLVETHHGHSTIIDLLRKYYDCDIYFDSRKKEQVEQYQGIKQGCAVSAWLANVILCPLDEKLSRIKGVYYRYSDDIIYVGPHYEEVTLVIRKELQNLGLELNEKKIEYIQSEKFIRFLGYYIRGKEITLSPKWVKEFQQNIEKITIRNKNLIQQVRKIHCDQRGSKEEQLIPIVKQTAKHLARYLYTGRGMHSWASLTLGVINREEDIKQLNLYCMDAIRAVYTGKTNIGGLGVSKTKGILRGKGKNVNTNLYATNQLMKDINYCSMIAMHHIIHNKWLFQTIVRDLLYYQELPKYKCKGFVNNTQVDVQFLEKLYRKYCYSRPNGKHVNRFYAKSLEELSVEDMLSGENRTEALEQLDSWISKHISYYNFPVQEGKWYWQSPVCPELVLLRKWFKK